MEEFDADEFRVMLQPETGIRALWLLYKRGQWGVMEDFGMDKTLALPALEKFEAENLTGPRLTKTQCSRLEGSVPGFREARIELQLAAILKGYDKFSESKDLEREKKRGRRNNNGSLSRRGATRRSTAKRTRGEAAG